LKITVSEPDQFFWIIFFISLIIIYYSFISPSFSKRIWSIIFLRFSVISLLIFLFLDPKIEFEKKITNDLNWNIYVDRSLSMSYHSHPSSVSLVSGIDEFRKKLNKKGVSTSIIGFGSVLDSIWNEGNKKLDGIATNVGIVLDHIEENNYQGIAGAILFTDGQVNIGSGIPAEGLKKGIPIHIVGIGDANPMVDVEVNSIDVPPLAIKGSEVDLNITLLSHGDINERSNVTLYQGDKLIGSKVISLSGNGSQERVRFRLKPSKTGLATYVVQVNALAEEVNIKNNKQTVQIQVLKDEYKIAILTGAPNFNTFVLKKIIISNPEFRLDHYVYRQNGFYPPLNKFWDKQYDLILFDNHPITDNFKIWRNYLKAFAKKLVSHQSNFAIINGPNMNTNSAKDFFSLLDLKLTDSIFEDESATQWNLTENWFSLFPFKFVVGSNKSDNDLPPLLPGMVIDTTNIKVLANFTSSDLEIPLFLVGQKNSLRFFVCTSPELYTLFYRTQDTHLSGILPDILNPIFGWLINTGGNQDIYFRSNKNSYQQGESILLIGEPLSSNQFFGEGVVNLYLDGKLINKKPLLFDQVTGLFRSQFWASQSGKIDYEIEFSQSGKNFIMNRGSFQVQESQLEMNKVYLNEKPLQRLATLSNGVYKNWDKRSDLISMIRPISKNQNFSYKIALNENIIFFLLILVLLTLEWIIRKKIGLM
tara:strand:+ start:5719 stop:7824 length:2106 start_codon:yes stop_codon:yes gene_type:complete